MNHRFRVLLASVALCGGWGQVALAQVALPPSMEAPKTAPAQESEKKSTHMVPLKNVLPSQMAQWLNAGVHSPAMNSVNPYTARGAKSQDGSFVLPAGIDRIVAIDPQHALLVFGTDKGVRDLTDTIQFLDKPLGQIEIEATWVQISREDAKKFGIDYFARGDFTGTSGLAAPYAPKDEVQLGFVRGDFQATLASLVAQNKAKILSAPHITAINNLTSAMSNFSAYPATVRFKQGGNNLAELFAGTSQIGVQYEISVTPTINNDDTITVLFATTSKLKVQTETGAEFVASRPLGDNQTIVNVRDGDTVALAGLSAHQTPARKTEPEGFGSNLMLFVTARIVHRAEDGVKDVALKR